MKKLSERRKLERKRKWADKFAGHCQEMSVQIPQPTSEEIGTTYRGRVIHVMHAHDDGCPAHGTGVDCTCKPDITYWLQRLPSELTQ